jgi:hypothetical protein
VNCEHRIPPTTTVLETPVLNTTQLPGKEFVVGSDDYSVGEWQAAEAVEFIRALQVQLRKMTNRLAWVERQGVTDRSSREMRLEAATLRRDIQEAQFLIDRLQRRYLSGDKRTQQRRPVRPPRPP